MAFQPRFALSRASAADLPELIALQYRCFGPFVREIFMGCRTEGDLPLAMQKYVDILANDPHDVWIKVVDRASGNIVAGSNWRVYPSRAPDSSDDTVADWLDEKAKEMATQVFGKWAGIRKDANPGGYVNLHICFTDPEYQRQGAGGMMLRWGCDLADQLFLPGWVEASPEGSELYRGFGFHQIVKIEEGILAGIGMIRKARTSPVYGGKPPTA